MAYDADWLLGRTFETAFTVLAVGDDAARTVTLGMYDDRYTLSLAELVTVIESGFVRESARSPNDPRLRRAH